MLVLWRADHTNLAPPGNRNLTMPVLVIGHKNPDTDAVCSALAYAWYLRDQGLAEAEAACCGEINARTQFVLNQAGIPPPRLVMDVRPTIGDVAERNVVTARGDEALLTVYRRMQQHHLRALPVLDACRRVEGLITFSHLMEQVLPPDVYADSRRVHTSLRRICDVLNGTLAHAVDADQEAEFLVMVAAMSASGFTHRMRQLPADRTLVVTGDRPTVHVPAIDYGVRALVVTGGFHLGEELLETAHERGVSVIYSTHDTATTTLLLRSAKTIRPALLTELRTYPESALVEQVARELSASAQELYPVVGEDGRLTAVFAKSDLVNPRRARLVLVDHNEYSQAVTGAEQAEIIEVIDHHRLGGGLVSREPIRFINEPVGSTCTIVSKFLHHRDSVPPREIGLCLVAGIVSDTLNLTSPTTTESDRRMLGWLAGELEVDVDAFAKAFFAAGSVLESYPAPAAVRMDCKDYSEGPWRFAVAQIEELGLTSFERHRAALTRALADLVREKNLHFAALMVTDITSHVSVLLVEGDPAVKAALDYPRREDLFEMAGVVSRKKQLLPHLTRTLATLAR